jgi:hypothetical protein
MKGLKLFGIALSIAAVSVAFASGWTVSVSASKGILFGPSVPTTQTDVPFIINAVGPLFAPAPPVFVNTLPQVNFQTASGNPNPILVGNGTSIHGWHLYRCVHHHQHEGAANWLQLRHKRVRLRSGTDYLDEEGGGSQHQPSALQRQRRVQRGELPWRHQRYCQDFSAFVPLAQPSSNVQVIESFIVHVDGAASAWTRHCLTAAGGARLGARACEHARAEHGTGRTAATPTREEVML